MSQVSLEIDSLATLIAFLEDAKKAGLLKDVSTAQVEHAFKNKVFPIRVPIDLNAVLAIAGNKVVRTTFGGKIQKGTVDILNKIAMSAG